MTVVLVVLKFNFRFLSLHVKVNSMSFNSKTIRYPFYHPFWFCFLFYFESVDFLCSSTLSWCAFLASEQLSVWFSTYSPLLILFLACQLSFLHLMLFPLLLSDSLPLHLWAFGFGFVPQHHCVSNNFTLFITSCSYIWVQHFLKTNKWTSSGWWSLHLRRISKLFDGNENDLNGVKQSTQLCWENSCIYPHYLLSQSN